VANWLVATFLLLFSGIGVSLGNHRLITHESFSAKKPVGYVLMFASALAGAYVKTWSLNHKWHHRKSDSPREDPHSPLMFTGRCMRFLWPQIGWLLFDYKPANARLFSKSCHQNLIDWQTRWYVPFLLSGIVVIPYIVAGWEGILLSVARFTLGIHVMGSVNSLGHMNMPLSTALDEHRHSRNNIILAYLFLIGEWWHDNHHAHPKSAYIGWKWWQIDLCRYILWMLKKCRLVSEIVYPKNITASTAS
jgi:stearoyl-CoA desaturase (Delta-9 desaturase)